MIHALFVTIAMMVISGCGEGEYLEYLECSECPDMTPTPAVTPTPTPMPYPDCEPIMIPLEDLGFE